MYTQTKGSQQHRRALSTSRKVERKRTPDDGGGDDNSQYEPTTQIHASDLLRTISEAGAECGYRRYESKSEHDERTAEQHSVSQAGEGSGWGKGDERKKERESNTAGILWSQRLPSLLQSVIPQ